MESSYDPQQTTNQDYFVPRAVLRSLICRAASIFSYLAEGMTPNQLHIHCLRMEISDSKGFSRPCIDRYAMNSAVWIRAAMSAGSLLKSFITDQIGEVPSSASPERRASILLRRAALRASSEIIAGLIKQGLLKESDAQAAPYAVGYVFSEIEIEPAQLEAPQQIAEIDHVQDQLKSWLISCGVSENTARVVLNRLPNYLPNAIYEEIKENIDDFLPLILFRLSPGYQEARDEIKKRWLWTRYNGKLIKQISVPMFDEPFSLSQIYIPIIGECSTISKGAFSYSSDDLMSRLTFWSCNRDKDDFIRVVSGGPGSGKSSFSKMLAANLCSYNELNTVHVHLGNVVVEDGFIDGVTKAVQPIAEFDTFSSIESGRTLVLIMDGLDELESQGKTTYQAAQSFLSDCLKRVRQMNQEDCLVKLIVLGRQLAIDVALEELGPTRLPLGRHHSVFSVKEFSDLQRDQWWSRYGDLIGEPYSGTPKSIDREELDSLTRQPLINYLIAISYEKTILESEDIHFNVNSIYEGAVRKAHQRHWSPSYSRQVQRITEDQFIELMECLALSIWHSDGNSVTEADFEARCKDVGLESVLEALRHDGASGVPSLLVAFFVRKRNGQPIKDPGRRYEFTHKTFREFLVSRLICKQFITQFEDGSISLPHLMKLCGVKPIDDDTFLFMIREFSSLVKTDLYQAAKFLFESLAKLIERDNLDSLILQYSVVNVVNMVEALFAGASACAVALQDRAVQRSFVEYLRHSRTRHGIDPVLLKHQVPVTWKSHKDIGNFFRIAHAARESRSLAVNCLSFIKSSRLYLEGLDISGAIMIGSNFDGAHFSELRATGLIASHSNFSDAQFSRVDFSGGHLEHALFNRARFDQVRFHEANLQYTLLNNIHASQSDFSASRLDYATGFSSNYKMCNLCGWMRYANFSDCEFRQSDFVGADLTGTKFERSDLRGCNFDKALAVGTVLLGTKLPRFFKKVVITDENQE